MAESDTGNGEEPYAFDFPEAGANLDIANFIEPSLMSESAPYEELGVGERSVQDGKLRLAKSSWTKKNMRNPHHMQTDTDKQVREFAYQIELGHAKDEQGRIDRIYFLFLDIHGPPDRAYPYRLPIAQHRRPFHELRAARHIICSIFRRRKGRSDAPPLQVVFANPAYSEEDSAWIEKVFDDSKTTVNVRATADYQQVLHSLSHCGSHSLNALVVSFSLTTSIRQILAEAHGKNTLDGILSVLCPRIWEFDGHYMRRYRGVEIIPLWMVTYDSPFGNLVWHQLMRGKMVLYEADIRASGRKRKRLDDTGILELSKKTKRLDSTD